uniref:Lysozyme g n=1 Tax=Chelonoidis abingdonii TaxID=106734 RepID=A0A8C0IKX7_CHEAB
GTALWLCLFYPLACTSESQTGCYGDINKVDTTGASCRTAKAEGLFYCGVRASTTIAAKDLPAMNKYKTIIKNAGRKRCVDPAVIAGIISRESHAGKALKDGWGDRGNGFVPDWGEQCPAEAHLLQGTGILVSMIKRIQKKFPRWTKNQQLKGTGNSRRKIMLKVSYITDIFKSRFYKRNGY